MILKLTANGYALDIRSSSFNLTLNSPVASSSGSYVYSFTIPNTVKNAKAFNYPHRLTHLQASQNKVPGTIIGDEIILKSGIWLKPL